MAGAIQYVLNIGGFVFMWWMTILSYGLIVRIPPCNQIGHVVNECVRELAFSGLIYLCVVSLLNWFVQRKFERRFGSREFLYLGAITLVVIALLTWYSTNQFVGLCGN